MFPAPHSALPLPAHPSLERYRKLAKELVKAANSADPETLRAWAERWVASLLRLSGIEITVGLPVSIAEWTDGVAAFARGTLVHGSLSGADGSASLTQAQFVLARAHGFASWAKFAVHLRGLEAAASPQFRFEAAAEAVVAGDVARLGDLLREEPALVRARSMREHRATLLHYTAANGVEGYRQRTPPNVVEIAEMLLQAGAEVDAEADCYGGRATTLGLAATSGHTERAGVQEALLTMLLAHGAKTDNGAGGNSMSMIAACLANGRYKAARFLAERGAPVGFAEAAALGHMEVLRAAFGDAEAGAPSADEMNWGLLFAAQYGQQEAVALLLQHGASLAAAMRDGQTVLHLAAMGGDAAMVRLLLDDGASLEAVNSYGGTPLGQALWSATRASHPDMYLAVFEALAVAGAAVPAVCEPVSVEIDTWLARRGCRLQRGPVQRD